MDESTPQAAHAHLPVSASTIHVALPDLGTGSEPVRVSAWFVEVGDVVDVGDSILEILMPGVTSDVCSPAAGRVSRLLKEIDAQVVPGEVVAWIETSRIIQ